MSLFGIPFTPKTANVMIVFNFLGKILGVPAQSAHLVAAYPHELSADKATGTYMFVNGEVEYYALDIPRLYEYLGK